MPFRSNMFADITAALGSALSANLTATSDGSDLYECYIWALVLEAAQREGGTIQFKTRTGATPASFYFRTSPSSIFSNAHDYCHAEINFPNTPSLAPLEVHVGIYVSGKSGVTHECDVAVLYKHEAETCRKHNVHPRSSKIILSVECKYYISSNLGINLGRSFLGLVGDIYADGRFFVSTQNGGSISKLFSRHKKEYEIGLSPLTPDMEIRLRGSFEKIFRDYKAV